MPEQTNRHELLSEEVQDIISYRPHWIVRKGNTVFMLIIALALFLTWVIQYPDKIEAPSRLVALNPPKLIPARTEGKIIHLFAQNDQAVQKDQPLAHIESAGDYTEVNKLQQWVDKVIPAVQDRDYSVLNKSPLPRFSRLGELQIAYQQFQNEMEITKQTLASGYYDRKKNALQKDLQYLEALKNNSAQQKSLIEESRKIDMTELEVYEKLAKEKVIAPMELNQYKEKLLAREQNLKQAGSQITSNNISSHGKHKEIMDLEKTVSDQRQQFYSALLQLKSEIEKWKQQYVITSPEEGRLVFLSTLKENELVSNGQGLFYVEPGRSSYYAELMAGQQGFGKIKTGQPVMLKLESYPSSEFGYLNGTISHISPLPGRNDSFLVKVDLPRGLYTNYGKPVLFRNNLTARAEIITENRRLSDRLLGSLWKAFKK